MVAERNYVISYIFLQPEEVSRLRMIVKGLDFRLVFCYLRVLLDFER